MSGAGDRDAAPAMKFCGLTRPEDAAYAAELGAAYLGVIFAGGPRLVTPERAAEVLGDRGPRRVGVVGSQSAEEIAEIAGVAGLDAVQLHGDPTAADVERVRRRFAGAVWAVLRLDTPVLPERAEGLFGAADAVLLDAKVAGHSGGGTGVALDWRGLAPALERFRGRGGAPLVLAGGLRPENVGEAIALIAPDVVDVASGVERAPGVKDHARMRGFAAAVAAARRPVTTSEE
jgi:phosphoribosylanthranilate isomerase